MENTTTCYWTEIKRGTLKQQQSFTLKGKSLAGLDDLAHRLALLPSETIEHALELLEKVTDHDSGYYPKRKPKFKVTAEEALIFEEVTND